ncbi:hypothetical protein VTI74DRAFT_8624 [Chaetomium olivicolor]
METTSQEQELPGAYDANADKDIPMAASSVVIKPKLLSTPNVDPRIRGIAPEVTCSIAREAVHPALTPLRSYRRQRSGQYFLPRRPGSQWLPSWRHPILNCFTPNQVTCSSPVKYHSVLRLNFHQQTNKQLGNLKSTSHHPAASINYRQHNCRSSPPAPSSTLSICA